MTAPAVPTTIVHEQAVWAALAEVADPEIPVVSIVDLGMIERVEVDGGQIRVELLPTFVGCPALEAIRDAIERRLAAFGRPILVDVSFRVPWTSDRITGSGRERLRESGFAPPSAADGGPLGVRCPYCGSSNVSLDNLFGPTQCRSILYCRGCRQPFEQFKTV